MSALHATRMLSPRYRRTTNLENLSLFCKQVSAIVEGGAPVAAAVAVARMGFEGDARGERFAQSLREIEPLLASGMDLSEAMDTSSAFPSLLRVMVAMGERTGTLPEMLAKVGDILTADAAALRERNTRCPTCHR